MHCSRVRESESEKSGQKSCSFIHKHQNSSLSLHFRSNHTNFTEIMNTVWTWGTHECSNRFSDLSITTPNNSNQHKRIRICQTRQKHHHTEYKPAENERKKKERNRVWIQTYLSYIEVLLRSFPSLFSSSSIRTEVVITSSLFLLFCSNFFLER